MLNKPMQNQATPFIPPREAEQSPPSSFIPKKTSASEI